MNFRYVLLALTTVLMLVDLYLMTMVAPTDANLGHLQRVFYFHVPVAVLSFLAFFFVFIWVYGGITRNIRVFGVAIVSI